MQLKPSIVWLELDVLNLRQGMIQALSALCVGSDLACHVSSLRGFYDSSVESVAECCAFVCYAQSEFSV